MSRIIEADLRDPRWTRRSRIYVPRGYMEGEVWTERGQWCDRRYFSMLVNSWRFGGGGPPEFDETYYLVTTAGAGGDGSIGSPWNTLEAARAGIIALHASFVTSTVNPGLICSGVADDATVTTNTWPTSSVTYYLTATTPAADRKAQWDANVYTYARSAAGTAALSIGTNSLRLRGLQVYQLSSASNPWTFLLASLGGELVMDGMKLRGLGGANSVSFRTTNPTGRIVLRNSLFFDSVNGIVCGTGTAMPAGTEVDIYNCTVIGLTSSGGEACWLNWAAGGAGKIARIKNLISKFILNGVTTTNENTEDLATNHHSTAGVGAAGVIFVDPGAADFRLVSGSSDYLDLGTDLSGVADFPFSDDASLYTRPYNGAWDRGFHEYRP